MGSDYLQKLWAGLEERICTCGVGHGSNEAHHIGCEWLEPYSTLELLMAMRDAGYRILAPGELDDETLERVAEFTQNEFQRDFESPVGWRGQFVAAIRSLTPSSKDKEGRRE